MKNIIELYEDWLKEDIDLNYLKENAKVHNIYPNSIYEKDKSILFITKHKGSKFLIILGKSQLLDQFKGRFFPSGQGKICELTYDNSKILGKYFPFTLPKSHKDYDTSIGLGDRLGLASIGHLKLIKDYKVFPVLAQQSIRELNLTDRTYKDVLASASWAVFQEGYTSGFGADGDHLKTAEEVAMALDLGFTMITLDCSDHIDNSIKDLGKDMVEAEYSKIDKKIRKTLEDKYLNKSFSLTDDIEIFFDESNFKRIILIYLKTIEFTEKIYRTLIKPLSRKVDFELSIDETSFTTSTEAHFLIGAELRDRKVEIASMAPRFPGEFQKGIDYIGDTDQFSKDFHLHHLIAQHFGYKISVHSGSDKFMVFPIIGNITKGHYHLKTAGTNWLEALRVIALKDTKLFRDIFEFALNNLDKARAYYHISGDPGKIPPLFDIKDEDLVKLLDEDNARQILHITYGLILQQKDSKGQFIFRDKIYKLLNQYEDVYNDFLIKHIGRHLQKLQVENK